jgi:hypothetical protein
VLKPVGLEGVALTFEDVSLFAGLSTLAAGATKGRAEYPFMISSILVA